jgi:hypothetical protein
VTILLGDLHPIAPTGRASLVERAGFKRLGRILQEGVAGRNKAQAVGRDLQLMHWDARHYSDTFQFTRAFALTAVSNTPAFWNHEQLGLEPMRGVDEVSLALVADAWSRTYRSRAITFAGTAGAQQSRNGIRIFPRSSRRELARGASPPQSGIANP